MTTLQKIQAELCELALCKDNGDGTKVVDLDDALRFLARAWEEGVDAAARAVVASKLIQWEEEGVMVWDAVASLRPSQDTDDND